MLLVAGLMVVGLLAVPGAYGFHRDELYFIVAGRHPALGYADQPPLTPLLSAASVAVLGLLPTSVRVLPAVAMALVAVLTALIARDLGGSRRAQVLAAITVALSGYLGAGHLDSTAAVDLLAWAIIAWLLVRLLAGGDRRLWLVLGVVTGIGFENKDTLMLLWAGPRGDGGGVVAALPGEERARAVILTSNYGEAGALELLGTGLPPVYSGHNGFWDWGPPPADRTVVVHVGDWGPGDWSQLFVGCRTVAHIDNRLGIANQEQGRAISVCSGLRAPWTTLWPRLRNLSKRRGRRHPIDQAEHPSSRRVPRSGSTLDAG